MPGRMTLAEQLASIRDEAPVEFDPEATDFGASTSAGRDLDAGRADYLEVGPSEIRRNLGNELDGRYAGTKSSRSELYEEQNGYESEDDDEDEELSGDEDEEDQDDASEQASMDNEEDGEDGGEFGEVMHSGSDSGSAEGSESEEDEEEDEDEPSTNAAGPSGSTKPESKLAHLDKDSREMIQELKKASSADVEKGKDVRKQLSFWDTLLEARIRLHKCVSSTNSLPSPDQAGQYASESSEQVNTTRASLEELSELLFSIRQSLYERNDKLDVSSAISKKRKRGSSDYVDQAIAAVSAIGAVAMPYEQTTISKWSDKVSSAAPGNQNKFKAIGPQNTVRQIEAILAQDMDKLVERTRTRRGGPSGKSIKVVGRDGAHEPVPGEKDASAEVYDDTDFYQALLRDVVDSGQGGASGLGGVSGGSYANFNNTSRKKAAGVDPKASKGRKLRYHVHEKLQHFMAPIPMNSWEKDQIDELFRGLLGGRPSGQVDFEVEADGQNVGEDVETLGQLRIFG